MSKTISVLPTGTPNTDTNFQRVNKALENTISRDGSLPNHMNSDLDMNNHDIINLMSLEVQSLYIDGEPVSPVGVGIPGGGNIGQVLTKLSGSSFDIGWEDIDFSFLSPVAISGNYNDLNNSPDFGSAALEDSSSFATAAQGILAEAAVQFDDLSNYITQNHLDSMLYDIAGNIPTPPENRNYIYRMGYSFDENVWTTGYTVTDGNSPIPITPGTIPVRVENGALRTSDPTSGDHAVNRNTLRSYVVDPNSLEGQDDGSYVNFVIHTEGVGNTPSFIRMSFGEEDGDLEGSSHIPIRTGDGQLRAANPVEDNDLVNLQTLNEQVHTLDYFDDLLPEVTIDILPSFSKDGQGVTSKTMRAISNYNSSELPGNMQIPQYGPNGRLRVGEPLNSNDAVRLQDVDERLSSDQREAINALDPNTATIADLINALQT